MSTEEEVKVNQTGNPGEYFYKPGTKVEIPSELFTVLNTVLENTISEEIKEYYPQMTKFEDAEGNEVKSPTKEQLEKGEVFEVFDVERTLDKENPKVYFTDKGLELMKIRLNLLQIHHHNIRTGVATHKSETEIKEL